ncbi:B-cell CLL/lymphoma 9-like protein isoform X3 [Nomascus leucogenys]|uniref:B-cell CLL/lymphoma 9-like protein isoform X3 n=1 Tax=Nomascus leucogenys TaxID=61853 RepID=UPI00122DACA9|nr:B-cell CLL/lymphoma 9-like protein isoform X3 [Nomascus leucogenys]
MGTGLASRIETLSRNPLFPVPPHPIQLPSPRAVGSSLLPSPLTPPPQVTSFLFGACCCSPCSSTEYLAGPWARTGAVAPLCVGAMRILANKTRLPHPRRREAPGSPPLSPRGHCPPAPAKPMHPENKLTNHGKTGNGGAQSQHQNVNQGPTCNLGSKGVGAGNHGAKANQISPSNSSLKNPQAGVPPFSSLKGKVKRERSVSVDSGEQREAGTPSLDSEAKEVAPRSKRRCVLERKQPYSGDEWCSGPDSEEDDKPIGATHNCNVADPAMAAPQLGPGQTTQLPLSESSVPGAPHGPPPGLRPDAPGGGGGGGGVPGKPPSQFVYVFTTHLANTAAEAVLQGRADSILAYHQQNVPRAKLDQAPKVPPTPEPLPLSTPSAGTPQSQPPPLPPPPPAPGSAPPALPPEGPPEDSSQDLAPNSVGAASTGGGTGGTHPNTPTATTANNPLPPGGDPSSTPGPALLGEAAPPGNGQRSLVGSEGLSKEQLEHRERSLQTLRDIERLLLRSGETEPFLKGPPGGASEGGPPAQAPPPPQQPPTAPPSGLKKYEEPLQSMISQTQSLGGPPLEHEVPGHPPGGDMGQQMNMMIQRLGQDSLTPEQVAWRKLQEEYYEEKRRKEEQIGLHGGRPLQDMMGMGGMIVRGPPPPYHSKPGDQWPPGMGAQLRGPMDVQDPMQLRGGPPFPGPRFPGNQIQRVPGFGGMQSMPMEMPMNAMQRPVRPGMGWTEDLPPMGGPSSFAQNTMPYPGGQGEAERFMTPRVREELLRHQLLEKRSMGMQRPLGMAGSGMGQSMEMERMMQAHRQMDPAMFPGQMAGGEGLAGTPMGMEFGGGRGLLSPPMGQSGLREVDPPMGPGNLNMNMNVNMNMNMNLNVQMTPQQQMLMSQKMRGPGDMMGPQGLSPEEMARVRAQNSSGVMGGPQKMLMPSQFPNQGQQGFSGGQGPYQAMSQDMGNTQDMFSPDQSSMPMSNVGTTRLSHMPLTPASNPPGTVHSAPNRGLGRRPSDLTISINQMGSPGMGHLKSPTLSQVHSPLVTSPSANLKSPQTPSQMVPLPSANPPGPLKSPQVLSSSLSVRSPTGSPSRLKSPSMAVPSPGWVASPKTAMPSPGVSQNKQPPLNMNSSTTMSNMEQGISNSQPSQMHLNSAAAQSPMGMNLPGQQPLSHEPPPAMLPSPTPLGSNIPLHPNAQGTGGPPQNSMMMTPGGPDSLNAPCGPVPSSSQMMPFPPRLQQPHGAMAPTGGGGGGPGLQQHYPSGMPLPPEDLPNQPPGPMPPQQHLMGKAMAGRMGDTYPPGVLPGVASVLNDPELSEVIRPTPTGIPEFDLSRIIPSEKPSSTLQYFPKSENQPPKAQPPNLHLMNLQNMMAEQTPSRPPNLPGQQGVQRGLNMSMCHPGQMSLLGRTGVPPQQGMVPHGLHQGVMSSPQGLMTQQNFMLMKQRGVGGEVYSQPPHMLSPQGSLMGPPPQQNLMVSHPLRQRSVSLDSQMGYLPAPGGMANLPF